MKRYQVYLNPNTVSILDEFEEVSHISRSKLIREAVDRLALNLSHTLVAQGIGPQKNSNLDSLVGSIKTKQAKTNYAMKEDHLYLED